jgi:DNA-binding transcriptional LysR family regulator
LSLNQIHKASDPYSKEADAESQSNTKYYISHIHKCIFLGMTNKIPVYLLESLVAFHRHGNLVATAKALGLTQPTVSRQFTLLEEQSPEPIFRNEGRRKVLTDYGLALATAVAPRLEGIEELCQSVVHQMLKPEFIHLKIGGRKEILERAFADLDFPGTLELIPMDHRETERRIQNHALDLAITHQLPNTADYIFKKLFDAKAQLIIPKGWVTRAPTAEAWAKTCHEFPACVYEGSLSYLTLFEQEYAIGANSLKKNFIAFDWQMIERRVHLQKGWTLIPSSFTDNERGYHIVDLPSAFLKQTFYLLYRKSFSRQKWFKDLILKL